MRPEPADLGPNTSGPTTLPCKDTQISRDFRNKTVCYTLAEDSGRHLQKEKQDPISGSIRQKRNASGKSQLLALKPLR